MKNIIVGTAGHVDHGKTLLIKALTGTDTDRLKEEKSRGITIELGFTNMPNDRDLNIGIIDVPGHERFVKNMLAGIGSIDIALLVVSGEEGVMPQTKEHFQIIKMLNIKTGIVVITKADLFDAEWLEIVKDDVETLVKGSFLEGAKIIEVSSYTGQNIEYLKEEICEEANKLTNRKEDSQLLRIPIDRVFSVSGFGTIITGTLIEGSCKVGEEIQIYPEGKIGKIRNIQVHGMDVDEAVAGQRTAINLANVKKEEISRGCIIAAKDSLSNTRMIDVKISMFDKTNRVLTNGSRLHLYYGSAEVLCKAVLLDKEILAEGEEGFVQLRLEEEIAVKMGDRFIISFYSPVETIGGGIILDANPKKHKRFEESAISALSIKEAGDDKTLFAQIVMEESNNLIPFTQILFKMGKSKEELRSEIEELVTSEIILEPMEGVFIHKEYLDEISRKSDLILGKYHEKNPISKGMQKEEYRRRLSKNISLGNEKGIDRIISLLKEKNVIKEDSTEISSYNFEVIYTEDQEKIKIQLLETYRQANVSFPETEEVIQGYEDKNLARQILEDLSRNGDLVKVTSQQFICAKAWEYCLSTLKEHLAQNPTITLGEFRDAIGASRKYAVIILEAFDDKKITTMQGDARIAL